MECAFEWLLLMPGDLCEFREAATTEGNVPLSLCPPPLPRGELDPESQSLTLLKPSRSKALRKKEYLEVLRKGGEDKRENNVLKREMEGTPLHIPV